MAFRTQADLAIAQSVDCSIPHSLQANMPAPTTNGPPMTSTSVPQVNGADSTDANDNIRRFGAPSRPLSPKPDHVLFSDKTRCFV